MHNYENNDKNNYANKLINVCGIVDQSELIGALKHLSRLKYSCAQ